MRKDTAGRGAQEIKRQRSHTVQKDTAKHSVSWRVRLLTMVSSAAVALLCVGNVAQGQVVRNGSFEDPGLDGTDTFHPFEELTNTFVDGWTMVSPSPEIAGLIRGKPGNPIYANIVAEDGDQYLYLAGGQEGPTYIEQTVSGFTIGASYSVTGFYAWPNRPLSERGSFEVSIDEIGVILPATTAPEPNSEGKDWTQFTASFVATAESQTIRIASVAPTYSYQIAIDNISIITAPEPTRPAGAAGGPDERRPR